MSRLVEAESVDRGWLSGLRDIDHVGITVPDREEAIAFFGDVLGAQLLMIAGPWKDPEGGTFTRVLGVHRETSIRVAMLRLGPGTTLELIEFTSPDQRRVMPKMSDWGAAHIALRVTNIDAAAKALRARALEVLEGPLINGPGPIEGSSYLYFLTPWGMAMELEERSAQHPYEGRGRHPHPAAPNWDWRPPGEIETEVIRVETAMAMIGVDLGPPIAALTAAAEAFPGMLDYWWRPSESDPTHFISYQRFRDRGALDAFDRFTSRGDLIHGATFKSDILTPHKEVADRGPNSSHRGYS